MLTEPEAWTLLERHCAPLVASVWAGRDYDRGACWDTAMRVPVDLMLHPLTLLQHGSTDEATRLVGAQLRLALGVAHAVSSCRGFEPATHQAFWRRAVTTLWTPPGKRSVWPEKLAFSATTFAHTAIDWYPSTPVTLASFWAGFLHGTPAHDALLTAVEHALQPHFGTLTLPPLHVSLGWGTSYDPAWPVDDARKITVARGPAVSPLTLRTILRVARHVPAHVWTTSARTYLGLVVEHRLDYGAAAFRRTLALVAHAKCVRFAPPHLVLSIDRLGMQLMPPTLPPPTAPGTQHGLGMPLMPRTLPVCAAPSTRTRHAVVARSRALGQLLRTLLVRGTARHATAPPLLRVDTVSLSECGYADFRHVGAVLSAVAWASPPIAALWCRGLFDATQPREHLLRLAWLAYALYYRRQGGAAASTAPWNLSLLSTRTTLDARERVYIEQLMACGTPLRDVVGEALRLRLDGDDDAVARLDVTCYRLGSSVWLARGTRLYVEPFRSTPAAVAVVVFRDDYDDNDGDEDEEEEFDLVALVADQGGWVALVYAGYGLMWTPADGVAAWVPLDRDAATTVGNDLDSTTEDGDGRDDTTSSCGDATSLALWFEGVYETPGALMSVAHRVVPIVPFVVDGISLTRLTLNRAVLTHDDLVHVLACCPQLHTLVLDRSVLESVAPLVATYWSAVSRRPALAMLSLLGVRDLRGRRRVLDRCAMSDVKMTNHPSDGDAPEWLAPLVAVLTSGVARGRLDELYVEIKGMASLAHEHAVLTQLAHAVATSSLRLTRLHVTCRHQLQHAAHELLSPLRDTVLADPTRVRLAVLSVLQTFQCALPEIGPIVVAMAEGAVVRTITWSS